jgi:DNA-binding HxlR family transcriptional regulator
MEGNDLKKLDNHCAEIFMVLLEKEAHFNELYRILKQRGIEKSMPTISLHLKHLVDAGYVKREPKEGSQLVIYSVSIEVGKELTEIFDRIKNILGLYKRYDSKKEFFELSEETQIATVLDVLNISKLYEIKARIAYGLEPEIFENELALLFWSSSLLRLSEFWMVKKCIEDKEYRKEILKIIDSLLKPK